MKVAIAGATGYTGGELLRLLAQHPHVEVVSVTSEQSAGEPLTRRLPFLKGRYDLTLESFDPEKLSEKADLIFVALSHTRAMEPVRKLVEAGKKVIDLSADYRLRSPALYEKWYGSPHLQPGLLKSAVYGLTEIYRNKIASAPLIANPGCYPTGALLPLYPFLREGVVDSTREVIIDAKSGVSGAGRTPTEKSHFTEVNEGMTAYNVGVHRHLPEIEQEMARFGGEKMKTLFTPYLLPVNRGILTTIYLPLNRAFSQKKMESILGLYEGEPFVRRVEGSPNLAHVRGSNFCDIGVFAASSGRMAILISAIDNLVKGASGQAIQNMNIMMGWDERLGLSAPGLFP
jgi:N-acetyl-gamma-glutamyl-phosphate reductase